MEGPSVQRQHLSGEECQVEIDMLPDELLLEIFDFCRELSTGDSETDGLWQWGTPWWWTIPVHVCRRWRNIIFESSRRLDLRVTCDREPLTLMRETLDIWPPFPITLRHRHGIGIEVSFGNCEEGLLAALKHQDRIAEIDISNLLDSDWEIIVAAMHKPLPALKRLTVHQRYHDRRTLPETLLGVSAPQLRSFSSSGFSFRAFPKFVLSASDIVDLQLLRIPHSGYVAPDMVATWLEALPKLKHFSFGFHSIESHPNQKNPFPPTVTRTALPVLTSLSFEGHSIYLEDLVTRIDTPLLSSLHLVFLDRMHRIPELHRFITGTERLKSFDRVQVVIHYRHAKILLGQPSHELEVEVCRPDSHVSRLAKMCGKFSLLLSCVERLDIRSNDVAPLRKVDSAQWLEIFRPFEGVQSLYVSKGAGPPVATALQDLTVVSAREVLPALQTIFIEGLEQFGSVWKGIHKFVATRQLSDRSISVEHYK